MSYPERPGSLDRAIAVWLQHQTTGPLRGKAGALTQAYKQGQNSSHIDLAAYLTTRMPATYAAVRRVLSQINIAPPSSILDVGAGPGTASWAALAQWPTISSITMIEADARFAALATELAGQSEIEALAKATITQAKLGAGPRAHLVIAAYVFAELNEAASAEAALQLWAQCENALVIIEPGTPRGFARIRNARAALIAAGANIIGPCTHANSCPMKGQDWCHFTQRLARSRDHMHAKAASVPFEDESFSWIAVAREKVSLQQARIIAPPITTKIAVTLKCCDAIGIATRAIASRDKAAYKQAKKLDWGDSV